MDDNADDYNNFHELNEKIGRVLSRYPDDVALASLMFWTHLILTNANGGDNYAAALGGAKRFKQAANLMAKATMQ